MCSRRTYDEDARLMGRMREATVRSAVFLALLPVVLSGCAGVGSTAASGDAETSDEAAVEADALPEFEPCDVPVGDSQIADQETNAVPVEDSEPTVEEEESPSADTVDSADETDSSEEAVAEKEVSAEPVVPENLYESIRPSLSHGPKPVEYQKYIMLHDTEGGGTPLSVIDWWDSNGTYVAAHFVIGKDGSVVQCVPLDEIAHHAGYGDAGHNDLYGIAEDGRDDMIGTTPIGDWAPDYAMNAWSVGIEMIHIGGEGDYPEEQLQALDGVIRYIDEFFGMESEIVDHKAWRTGNSDTSAEFAPYFANYQDHRTHD